MTEDADRSPDISDLFDELEELDDVVADPEAQRRLDEVKELAGDMRADRFGQVIYGFDYHDATEALLGSLLFGVPMAVEGGTNEAGGFVAANPLYLAGTLVATVAIVHAVLYVAEFQDVRVADPVLGVVPRRLLGVLAAALLTAVVLMTAWGRVTWTDPWLAASTVAVAVLPMGVGAALGDILPGS